MFYLTKPTFSIICVCGSANFIVRRATTSTVVRCTPAYVELCMIYIFLCLFPNNFHLIQFLGIALNQPGIRIMNK